MASKRTTRSDRDLTRSAMSSSIRSAAGSRSGIRQPTTRQSTTTRSTTRTPSVRPGAASPAESAFGSSRAGTKRKERDFESPEQSVTVGEETNINVVVRCRNRAEGNSAVLVKTDGVKHIELSMNASATSSKTYSFDRVYSPSSVQSTIFDNTVKPILDDMLAGYNCTIFAYGQTGTGKTYTMSGDVTENLGMLSDDAGIIPRVLQQLFNKLKADEAESSIKCSFIELYNEELRDLIAPEDGGKLKIYDDVSKRGHLSTVVQGMEEKYIQDAAAGIKVLQDGSMKRQVAATKCNDLSSRSHTVFTITVWVKTKKEDGKEDFVAAGKLNLVDLAGSENIQRSGAENKRAAEAGLINKSLLTLGRVINALVDGNSHIPYRESKLTRLLQDSLGGRTKTCIIATISPDKGNLEETISTLDYAFRAKNIKNKPQTNPLLSKSAVLNHMAAELDQSRRELQAARQRNGVHLPVEAYEKLTNESETRRILLEEQTAKVDAQEAILKHKAQEFLELKTSFLGLEKDHKGTMTQLDDTRDILEQVEVVLAETRKNLFRETESRKAHQETENKLARIGDDLINKMHKTTGDIKGLHAKDKRRSDLQSVNREAWGSSQGQVSKVTSLVQGRLEDLQTRQMSAMENVSSHMRSFGEELGELSSTEFLLEDHLSRFERSKAELMQHRQQSKDAMDETLDGIKETRDLVKERVGGSLQAIQRVAEQMAADVLNELTDSHNQLQTSFEGLGSDLGAFHQTLLDRISNLKSENDSLRHQLKSSMEQNIQQNASIAARIQAAREDERRQAAEERVKMISQITGLINTNAESVAVRGAERDAETVKSLEETNRSFEAGLLQYDQGIDSWDTAMDGLTETVGASRNVFKEKLDEDWAAADGRISSIQSTAQSVHAEIVKVVDEQTADLDTHMEAFDEFVSQAKSENESHHSSHTEAMQALSATEQQSLNAVSDHVKERFEQFGTIGQEIECDFDNLRESVDTMESGMRQPLAELRDSINSKALHEYQSTGETPKKVSYDYPTSLPRTKQPRLESPVKEVRDNVLGLREVDPNVPITSSNLANNKVKERLLGSRDGSVHVIE